MGTTCNSITDKGIEYPLCPLRMQIVLNIYPLAILESNYVWMIQTGTANNFIAVDPGDGIAVVKFLDEHKAHLCGILITHHHRDHIAGIDQLTDKYSAPVFGPHSSKIPQVTQPLCDKQKLKIDGLIFEILAVPGHTMEHIAYFMAASSTQQPLLFCGDALFAGGCGRRFEGDAKTMWESLVKLSQLPDETLIYCAHEYTKSNLEFALALEPNNHALQERFARVAQARTQNLCTLPSQLLEERATNPFLRCQLPPLQAAALKFKQDLNDFSPEKVFETLRFLKDDWPFKTS